MGKTPRDRACARTILALCVCAAVSACAGASEQITSGLPRVERAALEACSEPVYASKCGGGAWAADDCWDRVTATYGALPQGAPRKRWLIDAGCPAPTVEAWLPDVR